MDSDIIYHFKISWGAFKFDFFMVERDTLIKLGRLMMLLSSAWFNLFTKSGGVTLRNRSVLALYFVYYDYRVATKI